MTDLETFEDEWREANDPSGVRYGENHPRAILTRAQVIAVRTLYATGLFTMQDLADRYGCTVQNIESIINRKHRRRG